MVFDTKTAEHNIAVGYLDGLKFLGLMDGVLYAFSDPALWEHIDLVVARMLALSGDLAPHIVLPGGLDVSNRSISHLRGFLLRHISGFYRHKRLPKQRIGVTVLEMAGSFSALTQRAFTQRANSSGNCARPRSSTSRTRRLTSWMSCCAATVR